MKRDGIRDEAKKIMDEFVKALKKVESEEEVGLELSENTRRPSGEKMDSNFKEMFLSNAPKSKEGFIVAEKKKW